MAATTKPFCVTVNQIRKHKNRATKALMIYTEEAAKTLDQQLTIEQAGQRLYSLIYNEWDRLTKEYRCNPDNLKFGTSQRYRKSETEPFLIWCIWGTSNGGENLMTFSVTQEAD